MPDRSTAGRALRRAAAIALLTLGVLAGGATAASATPVAATVVTAPVAVAAPAVVAPALQAYPASALVALPAAPAPTPSPSTGVTVSVDPGAVAGKPSQVVTIIILMTVLSVAPALLILCTAFTKVIVVLSLTRNALGVTTIPPNQVLVGLALFLSLFIMAPVLGQMNDQGVQPYMKGEITQSQAIDRTIAPLKEFMQEQTRPGELATMVKLSGEEAPATAEDVPMTTLIPAFVLSELKSAFIIGFVIFVPFLVIDVVVSSVLMSMGMMMLPPAMISLPFKLLLFVMVDGWGLIVTALVQSYR